MNDVKSCPLCGAAGHIIDWLAEPSPTAGCSNEDCPLWDFDLYTPIAVWNNRPIEDAQTARIERLEAVLRAADTRLTQAGWSATGQIRRAIAVALKGAK